MRARLTITLKKEMEEEFPEACKFCLRSSCKGCPFLGEKKFLEEEILSETGRSRTLEEYLASTTN